MKVKTSTSVINSYNAIQNDIAALKAQLSQTSKMLEAKEKAYTKARKEVRLLVKSTYAPGKTQATIYVGNRKILAKALRYNAVAYENGKEIGTFRHIIDVEVALATGAL